MRNLLYFFTLFTLSLNTALAADSITKETVHLPLWKRDLSNKISPSPSFLKRGTERLLTKSASDIRFTGRLTGGMACTLDCGNCCTGNIAADNSQTLNFIIGSSEDDLSKIYNDGLDHSIKGYFYQTTGSCGMGKCTLFHITSVDQSDLPLYNSQTDQLEIPSVLVDDTKLYQADLSGPFTIKNAAEISGMGEDCSKGQQCAEGYTCISYFGIAGNELKSCEISCIKEIHCPIGQSCISIADGPQDICN